MRLKLPSNAHTARIVRGREVQNDFLHYTITGLTGWESILALMVELDEIGGFIESKSAGVAIFDVLDEQGDIITDFRLTAKGFVHIWQSGSLFMEE